MSSSTTIRFPEPVNSQELRVLYVLKVLGPMGADALAYYTGQLDAADFEACLAECLTQGLVGLVIVHEAEEAVDRLLLAHGLTANNLQGVPPSNSDAYPGLLRALAAYPISAPLNLKLLRRGSRFVWQVLTGRAKNHDVRTTGNTVS